MKLARYNVSYVEKLSDAFRGKIFHCSCGLTDYNAYLVPGKLDQVNDLVCRRCYINVVKFGKRDPLARELPEEEAKDFYGKLAEGALANDG